ncbi:MAG TPA: VCBS repeat-containing protein [Gaiellaceae bacterium]|nr:VCBS repeat-containing protein [Gaiellaceae bacterium]
MPEFQKPFRHAFRSSLILAGSAALFVVFAAGATGAARLTAAFAPSGLIAVDSSPCAFAVAMLDQDDDLDLAVTDCTSDQVTILLGDGAGHFQRAAGSPVAVGSRPSSIASADFDNDGNADLAVTSDRGKNLTILLGNGSGNFRAAPDSPIPAGGSPLGSASADINQDGRIDLLVPVHPRRVAILVGDGSGRFAPGPGSPLVVGPRGGSNDATIADVNGDEKPDLLISTLDPMRIEILLGDGAGRFRSVSTIRAGLKAVGDFNGDRRADLAVATKPSSRAPYEARVLLGSGSGRFSAAPPLRVKGQFWSTSGVAGDFNSDRKLDLALQDDGGRMSLLLGDGRGRLRPAVDSRLPLPASSDGAYGLSPADLNRDGRLDLVVNVRRVVERAGGSGLAILWQSRTRPTAIPRGSFPSRRDAFFSTKAPITHLAADGQRAAVATARVRRCGHMSRIVVWSAPRRRSTGFDSRCYNDGVRELALGGGQVAWLTGGGGNSLELILQAAPATRGTPRQVEFKINGYRASGDPRGSWVGQLLGAGSLLAYNGWTISCDAPDGYGCDDTHPLYAKDERLMRIVGGRRVFVKHGRSSFALAAVGGGRMAVEDDGAINVLAANGSRVAGVPAVTDDPPRAIALSRTRLAVLRTFTLDVYDPATGRRARSIPLGPAAMLQLTSANSTLALLRNAQRLVLVRLSDGKLISLALRAKSHVDAKLTSAGLFYAYNVRQGHARGRIVFEPTARLLARF